VNQANPVNLESFDAKQKSYEVLMLDNQKLMMRNYNAKKHQIPTFIKNIWNG
jgi:abortive infection bacteriophage resistance protein